MRRPQSVPRTIGASPSPRRHTRHATTSTRVPVSAGAGPRWRFVLGRRSLPRRSFRHRSARPQRRKAEIVVPAPTCAKVSPAPMVAERDIPTPFVLRPEAGVGVQHQGSRLQIAPAGHSEGRRRGRLRRGRTAVDCQTAGTPRTTYRARPAPDRDAELQSVLRRTL